MEQGLVLYNFGKNLCKVDNLLVVLFCTLTFALHALLSLAFALRPVVRKSQFAWLVCNSMTTWWAGSGRDKFLHFGHLLLESGDLLFVSGVRRAGTCAGIRDRKERDPMLHPVGLVTVRRRNRFLDGETFKTNQLERLFANLECVVEAVFPFRDAKHLFCDFAVE